MILPAPLQEHAAICLVAVLLDLLVGDPRWLPHPVVFMGRLIGVLEKVLRPRFSNLKLAGVVLLVVTVTVTFLLAATLLKAAYLMDSRLGFVVAVLLAFTTLAARSLHGESRLVALSLERDDLAGARHTLSRIVGRDTAHLEPPEIWRGTVETVAENSSDGVIAPLFYLMLGGPALALAYKAVNTLDSMVGYKNDTYRDVGWASARFDDLANWLPARLTGLLMVAAAPLVGLSSAGAWRIMRRDGRNHSSPNSGIPEAASAGALGVQLGGNNFYQGVLVPKPTIGDAVRVLDRDAYRGCVRLMYAAEGVLLLLGVLLYLVFSP